MKGCRVVAAKVPLAHSRKVTTKHTTPDFVPLKAPIRSKLPRVGLSETRRTFAYPSNPASPPSPANISWGSKQRDLWFILKSETLINWTSFLQFSTRMGGSKWTPPHTQEIRLCMLFWPSWASSQNNTWYSQQNHQDCFLFLTLLHSCFSHLILGWVCQHMILFLYTHTDTHTQSLSSVSGWFVSILENWSLDEEPALEVGSRWTVWIGLVIF